MTREAVKLGVGSDVWLGVGDKVHYDDAIWDVSGFEDGSAHTILTVVLESRTHGIAKEPFWLVYEDGNIIEGADARSSQEGSE